jgi:hypothetical protein
MALSEANQLTVCQILGVTPSDLEYQLTLLSTDFTAAVQSAVEAQITLWTTASVNYTDIEPKESNFGARIKAGSARQAIRERIAVLLERPDWANNGGSTARLVRA